ncbi:type II secretion system F family protein [Candidatus Gracilibacteria bacterium]|nr:type II secretion system F family protein [Candidatus Gracilibacteria bacterium]
MSSTHSHSPIDNNPNTDLETILKTPITPAKKSLNLLKNPKKREIIYGVTDRQNDPFLVKVNDFLIDHGRVTLKEKSLFFNSLRLLVNSGVPFTKSLRMLAKRTTNIKLFRVINTMVYDMEKNGQSFSGAMIKHPSIFSSSETKMIYSGEISGKIEKTLNSIATQLQKSIEFEMQIKSALLYPATVFTAIIIAGIIVVMFIIPQFVSLFAEFGGDLPLSTKTLLWISDFMIQFWWILLCFLIGSVFAFSSWKKTEEGRKEWDRFILNLPFVKSLINNLQVVRIASNFSTLMHSGIPVNKSLRVLGEIMPNTIIAQAIFSAEINVRKGLTLSESFRQESTIDPVLSEILEIGEQSGNIAEVLNKIATQYELEVDSQLKNLSTILEPLIILIVGGAVIFMALAILGPIFQLQELFSTGL